MSNFSVLSQHDEQLLRLGLLAALVLGYSYHVREECCHADRHRFR